MSLSKDGESWVKKRVLLPAYKQSIPENMLEK